MALREGRLLREFEKRRDFSNQTYPSAPEKSRKTLAVRYLGDGNFWKSFSIEINRLRFS